jgi:hypothetical protein
MLKKLEDFIGIYDGVINPEECNRIISCFENMKQLGFTRSRQELNEGFAHEKQDEAVTPYGNDYIVFPGSNSVVSTLVEKLWECYKDYSNVYSILNSSSKVGILGLKIQKTSPGEGYHVWHYENPGRTFSHRQLAFSFYLNTVDEGGETEFLYLKKRIHSIEGRLVLWPAGFTHTHRGNQPLSGDKYIVTGWIEWMD